MDAEELVRSLRVEADDRVRALWGSAEEEAADIDAATDRDVAGMRTNRLGLIAAETERLRQEILAEAERECGRRRRDAEQSLALRAFSLARPLLRTINNPGSRDTFAAFVQELPPLLWRRIRVNSRDAATAQEFFPDGEIIEDDAISGGLDVETDDGSIRVVNTLEKRLDNGWDYLLPELIGRMREALQG